MWNERKLARVADKILKMLRVRNAALDIILLDDRSMAALKARFIKKRTEPNVLSFPEPAHFPHPETKKRYLGEVYLNRDILRHSPERAQALLLHGVLHLLGYDHKKKADIVKMEGLERKILIKL
ncbi:MAG TPA: rRNA maturation RNase YbeY [Candidatus Paceibacterota bacterium]|nr:rRNA maturation RNase YbeY [Candidatus Paceibacterota bacterium]